MAALTPGRLLRDAVKRRGVCLQVPGAPNALAGRLIEQLGFEAAYLSSATLSAGLLAMPNAGLLTLTELAQQTAYLARQLAIPVLVDAGTGFGEVRNVERTVEELERAGAAAIQFQELPADSHPANARPSELAELSAKLRRAAETRLDADLVLIAAMTIRSAEGLEAAVHAATHYRESGADWILPLGLKSRDEFAEFARRVPGPLVASMTEFEPGPLLRSSDLAQLGYSLALYPMTVLRVFMKAAEAALAMIAEEGTQAELLDLMQTPEELDGLLVATREEASGERREPRG